ncbi:MAG: PAS domain S-box protein [Spirochaetales bacterium]|nr:PAS domain S-box protein [Spirochaetales bacterium]
MDNFSESDNLKKTQEALCASELKYRRLFETAKDGILILDAETGQIIDANPFLIDLLDYSFEQLVNKRIWDIGFFKDIIANKDNFITLKKNKYIRYEDMPLETANGKKIDVEFVSNVYQENQHYVIQCNIRDITERKMTAAFIEAERERLSVTLRSIGDGVIATDACGNIEIMNVIAEELCGWTQNEARGRPLADVFNIICEKTREPHENPVDRVLSTGKVIELENHTVIISKSGRERIISDSAAPIRNKANEIIGVILVFRDITEKQKLLESSQRNQKLESLGLLAGGIAHDFNNLMGGIFGYIDLAILKSTDSIVNQYLSKAMNTIEIARSLTRQLITFAKGGAPVKKPTSIFRFIEEAAQFGLSGSNVSCHIDMPETLWMCNIDINQIFQVVNNIVINAQQAMPQGGTIEISARNITLGDDDVHLRLKGDYVKFSIKDYGVGISKKILPFIFDPFFSTKLQGHGIGLSICYSIIKRHGGTIDVESVIDKGSTFHIYLPALTETAGFSIDATDVDHTGSGTMIVMDDQEVVTEVIAGMLETFGYSVVCAHNGREALEFFINETNAKRNITGLILDLTVPGGMGGKDIIKEIRTLNAGIPVIVVSGYADDPIMKNPEKYGFTASICKPFRRTDLAKILEKYMMI